VVDSEPDQRAVEGLVFDPTGVVPGLELSDDPLLRFRAAVYSESYRRRSQEARNEAAPSDMGQ
jgi:catalase